MILLITRMITDRIGLHSVLLPLLIILVIKQIGLPLRGRPILLITRMITDRIGFHSVLLPLLIIIIIIKVLDLGKLHHCKNSENRLHQLSCVISVIVENKPHAHLKTMNSKSSRFLSPVSKVSARNVWEHQVLVGAHTQRKIKKKGLHF